MMKETDTILAAIDTRIAEANNEIASLSAARIALANGVNSGAGTRPSPRRVRTRVAVQSPTAPSETAQAPEASAAVDDRTTAAAAPKRRRTASSATVVLPAVKLELLLTDADGLSTATLTSRTGADAAQVLTLLRELESNGKVRREGRGRGTRWRWITDEDRLDARAAELEAQFKANSRRRKRPLARALKGPAAVDAN
jgi:hypothetical protein